MVRAQLQMAQLMKKMKIIQVNMILIL